VNVLLDTGPLVALLNQRDQHHDWAKAAAGRLDRPLYTCEAVLTEAHYLLSRVHDGQRRLNELSAAGHLDLTFQYVAHGDRVHELMAKYATVPMAFADACLVTLAEAVADPVVFTLDSDFTIYRRKRNRSIDLLTPR